MSTSLYSSNWKRLLNTEIGLTGANLSQSNTSVDSTSLNSKSVYKELIEKCKIPPTAQSKYNSIYCDEATLDWKEIYLLPGRVSIDTYSRSFQYKILNRILYTNSTLFKMKLVSSPKCSFCQVHDESLEHLPVHCKFTQIFWSAVTTWLNEFNIGIGYLNEKIILLGVTNQVENYKLINHILIIGKQVIYSCRCKNVKPRLTLFQINDIKEKPKRNYEL